MQQNDTNPKTKTTQGETFLVSCGAAYLKRGKGRYEHFFSNKLLSIFTNREAQECSVWSDISLKKVNK